MCAEAVGYPEPSPSERLCRGSAEHSVRGTDSILVPSSLRDPRTHCLQSVHPGSARPEMGASPIQRPKTTASLTLGQSVHQLPLELTGQKSGHLCQRPFLKGKGNGLGQLPTPRP